MRALVLATIVDAAQAARSRPSPRAAPDAPARNSARRRRPSRRRHTESPRACRNSCYAARWRSARARQRLRRRLMRDRPMRAAAQRRGVEPGARRACAATPATWPGSPQCEAQASASSSSPKPIAIGRALLDQRQRLQRLDRRARIDRPLDVAERQQPRAPSASTTATAPRWRLSTSAPRITSTRTGLLICHAARLAALATVASRTIYIRTPWIEPAMQPARAVIAQSHRAHRSSPCSCCRSRRAPRSSSTRAAREAGAMPTGRAPAACRPRAPSRRRACSSSPAAPAAGRACSRCIAGSCSSARMRRTGRATTWSAGAIRCASTTGRRTGAGTATRRRSCRRQRRGGRRRSSPRSRRR